MILQISFCLLCEMEIYFIITKASRKDWIVFLLQLLLHVSLKWITPVISVSEP